MTPTAGLVDSHQHFWDLSARDQPWLRRPGNEPLLRNFDEADLRPLAAAAGVTATIVVQTVIEPGETPDLLMLAAGSDLVAGVVGWVDLQADDVGDALAALQDRPDGAYLRGIRHPVLVEADPDWLRRPAVHRGLSAVGAAGLCYDIVVPPEVLPAAADAVAACPEVTFVLDHLGNPDAGDRPDERWVAAIRRLGALPNVFCKLSGILGVPDAIGLRRHYETVLTAFGPDRLMFGSDWPPCTLQASYAAVVAAARTLVADLSAAEQAAILSGTAIRAYRLP
ncbi:MAG TPA: amidohydrolase family protein [Streptosporangiaceae bacterium]|nr:amidohydrolase family protein [Streptosporangiaceae bacterium]